MRATSKRENGPRNQHAVVSASALHASTTSIQVQGTSVCAKACTSQHCYGSTSLKPRSGLQTAHTAHTNYIIPTMQQICASLKNRGRSPPSMGVRTSDTRRTRPTWRGALQSAPYPYDGIAARLPYSPRIRTSHIPTMHHANQLHNLHYVVNAVIDNIEAPGSETSRSPLTELLSVVERCTSNTQRLAPSSQSLIVARAKTHAKHATHQTNTEYITYIPHAVYITLLRSSSTIPRSAISAATCKTRTAVQTLNTPALRTNYTMYAPEQTRKPSDRERRLQP
jgi:hypothetical protein